jgi:hypothetical protein
LGLEISPKVARSTLLKERAAMKMPTRLVIVPVAVLVLLALLTFLAVDRKAEEAAGAAVNVANSVVHDSHATVAIVGLVALSVFVMWTALRAKEGEGKAMPAASESSTSDPALSSNVRGVMKKLTRLKIGPVAVVVLLVLLTLLVVRRIGGRAEESVVTVVNTADTVVHDSHAIVAVVGLVALFAFVIWTALRAHGEDEAIPPAR